MNATVWIVLLGIFRAVQGAWIADTTGQEYLVQELSKSAITAYHPKQKYNFVRKIGAGKHGLVYEAYKPAKQDVKYAIKVLKLKEKKLFVYAINELEITRNLLRNEPNIIPYHEAYYTDNMFWLVMKYIDGVTLAHVPGSGLSVEVLSSIGSIMLKMVSRFEALGICHSDFTKSNIMVERGTGSLYVIDFGLSRRILPAASQERGMSSKDPNRIRFKESSCSDREKLYETFSDLIGLATDKSVKEDARITWMLKIFRAAADGKRTPANILEVSYNIQ